MDIVERLRKRLKSGMSSGWNAEADVPREYGDAIAEIVRLRNALNAISEMDGDTLVGRKALRARRAGAR